MRLSKIISVLTGADEKIVLGSFSEIGNLFGTRKSLSSDDELVYVFEKILNDFPKFLENRKSHYGCSERELWNVYKVPELVIADMMSGYYAQELQDVEFVKIFTRVLIDYYHYDGSSNSPMTEFCDDLMKLIRRHE